MAMSRQFLESSMLGQEPEEISVSNSEEEEVPHKLQVPSMGMMEMLMCNEDFQEVIREALPGLGGGRGSLFGGGAGSRGVLRPIRIDTAAEDSDVPNLCQLFGPEGENTSAKDAKRSAF